MKGVEFFPGGCVITSFDDKSSYVVEYDTMYNVVVEHTKHIRDTAHLTVDGYSAEFEGLEVSLVAKNAILSEFLKYKRSLSKSNPPLERIARSLESLEFVPGVPGGESEAAVERCKKRARGEGEENDK